MTDSSAPMAALAASRAAMQAAVSALHMALCANSIASCARFAATLAPADPVPVSAPPVPSSAPPVPPTDTGKGDAYKARLHAQWRGWDPIPVPDSESESESDSDATESESESEDEDNALVRYARSVEHWRKRSREDFPGDPDEDTVIPAPKRPYLRRLSVDEHWTKFGLEPDVMYRAVRKPFMGRETRCIVRFSGGTLWCGATPSARLSPVKADVTPWRAYGDFLRVPLPNHDALRVSRDRA